MKQHYKDIEYNLQRSNRKTASIYIERDGQVSVRVPAQLSDDDLTTLIESKRRWIYKNKAEWEILNASRVQREYVNGEGFLYLGRSYRLKFVATQTPALQLQDGYFCLSDDRQSRSQADAAFKAFYREKGQSWIRERIAYFQAQMGVQITSVRVMELQHRWASCSPQGNLCFHWKCMMAPLNVLDYIVVHELAHLIHLNHSTAFWHEVDKILPDYHNQVAWLREHGAGMDLS
jgi:predicted metal-dependent hydrolase